MTGQERQEGAAETFPRIPKAIVDRFIEAVWQKLNPEKKHEIARNIEENDPHLEQMIEECALGFPEDTEGVRVGAYFMFEALSRLEQGLPSINESVAGTLREEYMSFGTPTKPISPFIPEQNTGKELANPTMSPYYYAEENPSLMVWVAMLPDESMRMGSMLVYELKRRQFHSNKLSEQLSS